MSTFATDRPVTIVLDHYCSEYKYNVWCKQYKTVKFYPLVKCGTSLCSVFWTNTNVNMADLTKKGLIGCFYRKYTTASHLDTVHKS